MEKTLQTATDIELKAEAYDTIMQIQYLQTKLNTINNELAKRVQNSQPNVNPN